MNNGDGKPPTKRRRVRLVEKYRQLQTNPLVVDEMEAEFEEYFENDDDIFLYVPESIIVESPEIIRSILSCLSLKCLKKCSRVCKTWKFYANKILSERQTPRTFMISKLTKSNWSNWQAVADIVEVADYFKEIDIDSKFILLFGKLPLSRPCVGGNDLLNLRFLMPPTCPILGCLSSAGIIGTQDVTNKTSDIQNPKFDCFSCMCFPKIDGLQIKRFHLTLEKYQKEFRPTLKNLNFGQLFGITDDDHVKCLILICPSYYPLELTQDVFNAFYKREHGQIALAGGVCEDVIEATPEAHEIAEFGLTGLAFCGDDRVSVGSFIIPSKTKSKKAVHTELQRLCTKNVANKCKIARKSFGFIFTCCGRGTHVFKTSGVETDLIKETFPNTPFVGCFSLGEYGLNYWSKTGEKPSNDVESSNYIVPPEILYSYTTTGAVIYVD